MVILRTRIPPTFCEDPPFNSAIQILDSGDHYIAYVQHDLGRYQRFNLNLTGNDVISLNIELQNAVENVSSCLYSYGHQSYEYNKAINELAKKGKYAFNCIFPDEIRRESIRNCLERDALLQIVSERFFVPWELLYDGSLDARIDVDMFWGMRYIISRVLIQDARPGDMVSNTIESSCPRVGLICYDKLDHVANQEVPLLVNLHQEKKICLSKLRPLCVSTHTRDLQEFGRFLSGELELAHLACDARQGMPQSQSCLVVSDDFSITIEDFKAFDINVKNHPFVILNACLTGTINPLCASNWAATFWELGARGVLATEFHVPDQFAADFISEIYRHILSGKNIGVSLLTSRRRFWSGLGNVLGLAYSLYSSPNVRIEPGG